MLAPSVVMLNLLIPKQKYYVVRIAGNICSRNTLRLSLIYQQGFFLEYKRPIEKMTSLNLPLYQLHCLKHLEENQIQDDARIPSIHREIHILCSD